MIKTKKILSYILAAVLIFVVLPNKIVSAADEPNISLGSAALSGGKYYYSNCAVSGNNIRTILISFSDSVTAGDKIFLPASPSGFTVSVSSLSNDYVKRINLDAGISTDAVQIYLRGVGFTVASETQSVEISITTENILYDTYYNIDKQHYYQFIPDTSSSWISAYNSAKSMTYMGRTGYLATIMSKDEDTFVNSLSGGKTGWLGGTILASTGSTGSPLYYDGFNTNSVVSTGWYWACGPEKGTTFYNVNSLYPNANSSNANTVDALNTSYYYNWARGTVSYEPNNQTAAALPSSGDYETCLTTLVITNNTGKAGTLFSWNDKHYNSAGTGEWDARGYFVEYGNEMIGDSGTVSTAFASDSGTLNKPSVDISLSNAAWINTASYTCNIMLSAFSQMVTISVDSGYFSVPSLGGALTFRGGTSETNYINSYSAGTHFDSAVFSFTDVLAAQALLSDIIYTVDGTAPQAITAVSSTISPQGSDIYFDGHYYRYVSGSIDWPSAVLAAGGTSDPYFGGRGYLATATTQAENSILLKLVDTGGSSGDHWNDAWMGGIWQRNTGSVSSPNIIYGTGGNEITYADLSGATADQRKNMLLDYTIQYGNDSSNYIFSNPDIIKYYWVDGPEAGQEIANNTDDFAPWHTTSDVQDEPNNGDFIYIGWEGAFWDDLSAYSSDITTSGYAKLGGYIVEFSGFSGGSADGIIKEASKTTSVYLATINTYIDNSPADATGNVQLRQNGSTVATALNSGIGIYAAPVPDGTYDIYINNEDTDQDIAISGTANNASVNYYTVSFSAADAGKASGSVISCTADGLSISGGVILLSGKEIIITASGAGADEYAYVWSGDGTGGETVAVLTIPSLNGPVNANCIVTGTICPPDVVTDTALNVTSSGISLSGSVMSGIAGITERGFVYGTVPNPALGYAASVKTMSGSGTGIFTATLSGLKPDTVYYARAYAVNNEGTSYGEVISFKTEKSDVPSTGDNYFDLILIILCVLSLAGIIMLKKKKEI